MNPSNFHEKMWMSLVRLTLIPLTSQGFLQVGTQILQESESSTSSALHLYGSYNFLKIIIWSTWDRNVWIWASESLVERPFHIQWILFRESSPCVLLSWVCPDTSNVLVKPWEKAVWGNPLGECLLKVFPLISVQSKGWGQGKKPVKKASHGLSVCYQALTSNIWPLL